MLSDLVEEIGPLMGPSDVCKIYSEVWPCNKNRIFYSPVDVQHSAACCPGDCAQHPLLRGIVLQMRHEMIRGGSRWGDEIMKALEQAIANETPEERAARVAKEAAADEKSYNGIVTYSTKTKADKWCTKSGQMNCAGSSRVSRTMRRSASVRRKRRMRIGITRLPANQRLLPPSRPPARPLLRPTRRATHPECRHRRPRAAAAPVRGRSTPDRRR